MCQSLKAKVRSPGPLAPGAQWLWARLEPMGHGRPSPLRRTMPRRFGQNFLQTWRLMRCRLADSRIRGNQKSEDGQAGLGLGGRGHGEIPRARPSAPSSSLSLPVRTAPGRIGHCARALASPLCAWGQTAKATEQTPYARASQTLKPPVKTGARSAAGTPSPAPAPGYAHTDTRMSGHGT